MRSLQITAVLTPVVCFGACAANSPCERGDWYAIGEDDGQRGTLVAIDQHADACDLEPNLSAEQHYAAGLAAGLQRYCEPREVYERGIDGEDIGEPCTAASDAAAQTAHALGVEQRALRVDLARIAAEQAVQQKLRKSVSESLQSERQFLSGLAPSSAAYADSLEDVQRYETELSRIEQRLAALSLAREAAQDALNEHRREAAHAIARLH
ncbi:MAG: DUF2799 domain-containing protein [Pseudomonadota bacterium]